MAVALFGQNFGRNVIWRPAQCPFALPIKLDLSGQAKITNFDLHFSIEENITELKINLSFLYVFYN